MINTVKRTALVLTVILCLCLVGCGAKHMDTVKPDGSPFSFELKGKKGIVTQITVTKDGKSVCELDCDGTGFEYVDMNFDGHGDIRLKSSANDGTYNCFVYQPNTGTFTKHTELGLLIDPTFNTDAKEITCKIYKKIDVTEENPDLPTAYIETKGNAVWFWNNGVLTQKEENGIEYYSADGIYCVYKSSVVNGTLERNSAAEKWYTSLDSLKKAGYDW
jgi:hypothetical protein